MEESVIEKIEEYLDGKIQEIPLAVNEAIGCTVDYAAEETAMWDILFRWPFIPIKISGSDWTAPTEARG